MSTALRALTMNRQAFLAWAEVQSSRYEFDGSAPVAMTGGTAIHSQITGNIQAALRTRLRGGGCRPLGPDAGIATIGDAVRYPDALITCSAFSPEDRLIPNPVVVFEVISPGSERADRIDKVREYQGAPTILRYIIVEQASIGATIFERSSGSDQWIARTVTTGETLPLPEVAIDLPLDDCYEGTALAAAESTPIAPYTELGTTETTGEGHREPDHG